MYGRVWTALSCQRSVSYRGMIYDVVVATNTAAALRPFTKHKNTDVWDLHFVCM